MTVATATKTTIRRRKKIVTPVTPPEPPKCANCGHALTWRDRLYVPAAQKPDDADETWTPPPPLCKTCHQRGARRRLGVVAFHPATARVKRGDKTVEVLVQANRAARRQPVVKLPDVPRDRKPTRAERRAKTKAKAAQTAVA